MKLKSAEIRNKANLEQIQATHEEDIHRLKQRQRDNLEETTFQFRNDLIHQRNEWDNKLSNIKTQFEGHLIKEAGSYSDESDSSQSYKNVPHQYKESITIESPNYDNSSEQEKKDYSTEKENSKTSSMHISSKKILQEENEKLRNRELKIENSKYELSQGVSESQSAVRQQQKIPVNVMKLKNEKDYYKNKYETLKNSTSSKNMVRNSPKNKPDKHLSLNNQLTGNITAPLTSNNDDSSSSSGTSDKLQRLIERVDVGGEDEDNSDVARERLANLQTPNTVRQGGKAGHSHKENDIEKIASSSKILPKNRRKNYGIIQMKSDNEHRLPSSSSSSSNSDSSTDLSKEVSEDQISTTSSSSILKVTDLTEETDETTNEDIYGKNIRWDIKSYRQRSLSVNLMEPTMTSYVNKPRTPSTLDFANSYRRPSVPVEAWADDPLLNEGLEILHATEKTLRPSNKSSDYNKLESKRMFSAQDYKREIILQDCQYKYGRGRSQVRLIAHFHANLYHIFQRFHR